MSKTKEELRAEWDAADNALTAAVKAKHLSWGDARDAAVKAENVAWDAYLDAQLKERQS